jgi:hypothetical protein
MSHSNDRHISVASIKHIIRKVTHCIQHTHLSDQVTTMTKYLMYTVNCNQAVEAKE